MTHLGLSVRSVKPLDFEAMQSSYTKYIADEGHCKELLSKVAAVKSFEKEWDLKKVASLSPLKRSTPCGNRTHIKGLGNLRSIR